MATTPGAGGTRWRLIESRGAAGPFHARTPADDPLPSLWLHRVDRPALVLGSTQPAAVVDHTAAAVRGMEVARRRSGGGLVLVHPDHARWLDVVIPRGHPRWCDDVGRSFLWLGRAWAAALRATLPPEEAATVRPHEGRPVTTPWSSLLCFAGLGWGEVTVGDRKVVGMSQRRTRRWARFQCLLLADADLDLLAEVVRPAALPGPEAELRRLPFGHRIDLDASVSALLAGLERSDP